jgi:Aspartyl protease
LSPDEIPVERCDRLPVVRGHIGASEVRFLLDTGATTVLNVKSFTGGRIKEIQVTSWTGTAATSAREVSVAELSLGSHRLRDLRLPAINLSPIGNACGGPIDGILGVDLLDKMAVTIDLKRQVASLGVVPADPKAVYDETENAMGHCTTAFEQAKAEEFETCLDPENRLLHAGRGGSRPQRTEGLLAEVLFPLWPETPVLDGPTRRAAVRKRALVFVRVQARYSRASYCRARYGDVPQKRGPLAHFEPAQFVAGPWATDGAPMKRSCSKD